MSWLTSLTRRWRNADITMMHKAYKDWGFLESYRSIILLSNISKVAESLILLRLRDSVRDLNPISEEPLCRAATVRLSEAIRNRFSSRKATGAEFLDFASAFDTVRHTGLFYKFVRLGVPGPLVSSYLSQTSFRVHVDSTRSSVRFSTAGVPQGSLLEFTLYNF